MSVITDFGSGFKALVLARIEYDWARAHNGSESMGAYLEVDWDQLNKDMDAFCAEFKAKQSKP